MVTASSVQITVLRGRDDECREIRRLLDGPTGGGALLFHGEPGSGRTALVTYAHRHAGNRAVLAGTGLADEAALPYAGLQRLLDPVLDRAGTLPEQQQSVLRRALTGEGCPACHRLALSMAVLGLLAVTARERPLLCTMDDVDQGDRPTAEVLAFVARRLRDLPVAVVLTAGADTTAGGIPSHRLGPLDEGDSHAVLADRLPGRPPASVATVLTALGAGNPQALVDLAGVLTPGQWRGEEPLPDTPPPDGGLGRAYRTRLDRLPQDTRRVLLLAALDQDGDPATLIRSARAAGTTVDALAPAEAAGLVRVDPRGVTFPQPLARAMVEATATLAERRTAHLLLAGMCGTRRRLHRAMHLAAVATGPDPLLATELEEAAAGAEGGWATASAALRRAADLSDEPARAAARLVTAARYAWSAGRPDEARLLLGALSAGPADPAVSGRADLLHGELELRCGSPPVALTTLLAGAEAVAGTDRAAALAALARAGEAACFSGDQYRYADVARRARHLRRPDDPPAAELTSALVAGVAATLRADHERAGPALRRAVVLGDRLTGPEVTPTALCSAAVAGLLVAVDSAAHRLADRAVALARARGELSVLPRALDLRAVAEYWLGRHEAATDSSREGLRVARATGQANCVAVHLGMLAVLAAVRADRATSLRRISEIGEATVPGSRPHALAQWALGVLDLVDGRHADSAARLASLARPGTGRGQVLVQVMATPYLVEAAAHLAHHPAASAALAVFDRWASSTASPSRRALSARCHALLAPRGSDTAEQGFRTALRLHPADAGTFERARTELLFGLELRRSRRPRDARAHLHRAREAFTLLGAGAWAAQATAELRAAGESVGAPDRPAAQLLTGQQLRIAQLVAEGATNREVAARMFLSTRTVDHHLRNIFHRLGIRSRIELARVLS
ncbi:helix-turn-helix transcriptional regulator [Micromonospora halophytica]|uniref:ATP-, maltotriose-and DNA-dependent transcriptional regulator MalT n=1 Tax=Micromonospora halophytica TaxID=47864 RepID=A0A1C5IAJ1_9ACTN|nr:LuxR family transcriptional regulator [Micromonospora halophytica]SCG55234.1 ATP-, maltotriose-and DNA-dependent transcriptional regulator MalT [Micromonospora halophytica]